MGRHDPARERLAPDRDVRGDGARRAQGAVRDRREPGPVGGRRRTTRSSCCASLDHLVVQDIFLTKTAELADVVLPGSASWCESEGTVTNSERRVQLVPQGARPAGRRPRRHRDPARGRRRLGHEWNYGTSTRGRSGTSCARCRRCTPACRTQRLEELGGIQWPCYSEDRLEPSYLHGRLWADDPADRGRLAPFSVVVDDPPVDLLDDEFPLRLTTGRRLDSYNTGVQSGGFQSPLRFGETIDVSPEDADRLRHRRRRDGARGRRGAARSMRRCASTTRCGPGLVFMTFHFPDEVDDQPVDDRRHRPEVGHRRVQGRRGADRQDRRPRAHRGRLTLDGWPMSSLGSAGWT